MTATGDWSPADHRAHVQLVPDRRPDSSIQSGPSDTYVLTEQDKNRRIFVEVTGSFGSLPTLTVQSETTDKVAKK